MVKTIEWTEEGIRMINQLKLPHVEEYFIAKDHFEVSRAIKDMIIRGAPAIGVAAAMGIALAMKKFIENTTGIYSPLPGELVSHFDQAYDILRSSRPTAVNLTWALDKMKDVFYSMLDKGAEILKNALIEEALKIYNQDIKRNTRIGEHGQKLIPDECGVLTHCNAGALATAGYGTALGIIKAAHDAAKKITVYVDETRPYLQGARLTAWELLQENINAFLITDNMAGYLMKLHKIHCVIVGADRIAANGDTANKIGTYSLAVLSHFHKIPFYVAAPTSTIDIQIRSGDKIPIEWRSSDEVKKINGMLIAPAEIEALHPAFDVTPSHLISAIITEYGIIRKPYLKKLVRLCRKKYNE